MVDKNANSYTLTTQMIVSVALDRGVDVSNSDQTFFRDWSFNTFLGSIEYLERHKKKQEEK